MKQHLQRTVAEMLAVAEASAYRTEQGCLIPTLWAPQPNGYVRAYADGVQRYLHRFVVGLDNIPEGFTVDHDCHNRDETCPGGPCLHRRCFERSHLAVRSSVENWERGQGRYVKLRKTHCPHGHSLSGDNLRFTTRGHRVCRACHRIRERLRTNVDAQP